MVDRTSLLCDQHKLFSYKFRQEWRLKGNGLDSDRCIPFDLWFPPHPFPPCNLCNNRLPCTLLSAVLAIGALEGERREKREWCRTIYIPGSVLMWLPGGSLSLHQRSLLLSTSACYTALSFPLCRLLLPSFLWVKTAQLLWDSWYFPLPVASPLLIWRHNLFPVGTLIGTGCVFISPFYPHPWRIITEMSLNSALFSSFFLEHTEKNLFLQF